MNLETGHALDAIGQRIGLLQIAHNEIRTHLTNLEKRYDGLKVESFHADGLLRTSRNRISELECERDILAKRIVEQMDRLKLAGFESYNLGWADCLIANNLAPRPVYRGPADGTREYPLEGHA